MSLVWSIAHHDVEGPAARSLNVPMVRESYRRSKEGGVGHHGVIFAAFAARINAKPFEFRKQFGPERAAQPGLVEELAPCGDDRRLASRRDPLMKQCFR